METGRIKLTTVGTDFDVTLAHCPTQLTLSIHSVRNRRCFYISLLRKYNGRVSFQAIRHARAGYACYRLPRGFPWLCCLALWGSHSQDDGTADPQSAKAYRYHWYINDIYFRDWLGQASAGSIRESAQPKTRYDMGCSGWSHNQHYPGYFFCLCPAWYCVYRQSMLHLFHQSQCFWNRW